MNRIVRAIPRFIARRFETWARAGSIERLRAWDRAAKDTRRLRALEHWDDRYELYPRRRRRWFARRRRSSAEIIAKQVLGRRKARYISWVPFR